MKRATRAAGPGQSSVATCRAAGQIAKSERLPSAGGRWLFCMTSQSRVIQLLDAGQACRPRKTAPRLTPWATCLDRVAAEVKALPIAGASWVPLEPVFFARAISAIQ